MHIKKYSPQDLELLMKWFSEWDWAAPTSKMIPENSYFVYRENEPIAFSCFLKTDTNMALMGYTIVNKSSIRRLEALEHLLEYIVSQAKEQGFEYMQYYTTTKGMVLAMEKQGFVSCSSGKEVYLLVKGLGGDNLAFFDE
jgi:hypothetical protein